MASDTVTEEELDQLVRRTADAATAYLNGDMQTYVALIGHTEDYTLLAPYGGEPRRGFDSSDRALAATAGFFRGGEASLEVFQTYASGDLVVLVAVERQHGEVGGLPDQDWSLRVTLVYRRGRVRVAAGAPPRRPAGARPRPRADRGDRPRRPWSHLTGPG
jgi:ketosteroid isomerase-like protein